MRVGAFVVFVAVAAWGCSSPEAPSTSDGGKDVGTSDGPAASDSGDASCSPWAGTTPDAGTNGPCSGGPSVNGSPSFTQDFGSDAGVAAGTREYGNLTFGTRGGRVLQGDLFVPQSVSGKPGVLVVLHGGGWNDCQRRRDDVGPVAQAFAKRWGMGAFAVEYRLVQEGGVFPENLMDARCAVQWIASHAKDYGLDGARIGVVGESAGAQLALLLATTTGRADLDPKCGGSDALVAAIGFSGPYDLHALETGGASSLKGAGTAMAGAPCGVAPSGCVSGRACDRCVDASPRAHACTASARVLLVHAQDPNDPVLPQSQAQGMYDALLSAGRNATLFVPGPSQMKSASCPDPAGVAHGFSPCLVVPALAPMDTIVGATLAP
jgi:acetyl esterase/lipase